MGAKNARKKRNACGSKRRFNDQESAFIAAKIITKRNGQKSTPVRAYRCPFCGKFHWGHSNKDKL